MTGEGEFHLWLVGSDHLKPACLVGVDKDTTLRNIREDLPTRNAFSMIFVEFLCERQLELMSMPWSLSQPLSIEVVTTYSVVHVQVYFAELYLHGCASIHQHSSTHNSSRSYAESTDIQDPVLHPFIRHKIKWIPIELEAGNSCRLTAAAICAQGEFSLLGYHGHPSFLDDVNCQV